MGDTFGGSHVASTAPTIRRRRHTARPHLGVAVAFGFLSLVVSVGQRPQVALGDVLLRLQPGAAASLHNALAETHVTAMTRVADGTYRLRGDFGSAAFASHLATLPGVVYAEPNGTARIARAQSNDPYAGYQWALPQIKAFDAWDITTGSSDVIIAILDTGVSATHPDIQGKVLHGYCVLDGCDDGDDDNGHGTYVAGIAAARGDDNVGIAGVDWGARILPVKIANSGGEATNAAMAAGIRYAADSNARIINISLSGPERSRVVEDAVRYALAKGVVIVAAAGNDGKNAPAYPADYDGVIAVGASTQQDSAATFSNYGTSLDLVAPGVGIIGDDLANSATIPYRNDSGTSSATPFVTGTIGLMLSLQPNLTPAEVKRILLATSDDVGARGFDTRTGWGRLNVFKALWAVQQGQPISNRLGTIRGRVVGDINPADVVVSLTPGDSRVAGVDGYSFGDLPPGTYTLTARSDKYGLSLPQPISVTITGGAGDVQTYDLPFEVAAVRGDLPAFRRVVGVKADVSLPAPISRTFTATGHTLKGSFRQFWEQWGGVPVFGYPISEEFVESGQTVQYFERALLELHPEYAGTPNKVLLGRIGSQLKPTLSEVLSDPFSRVRPLLPTADDANTISSTITSAFFATTGHSVNDGYGFLRYWQAHGGQTVFGYPLSEEFDEVSPADGQTYRVQYFERARFEYHPDAPSAYSIQLGLVGSEFARTRGYLTPAQ